MILVPIILLALASVIMSVFYAIFKDKGDWQGYLVRSLTTLLLLVYAIVTINLTSILNALSLFVVIALVINIFNEGVQTNNIQNQMAKQLLSGFSNILYYLAIALSLLSLASFEMYALLGGLLLGMAVGLIICGIKKYKDSSAIILTVLTFASIGLGIGFGINNILNTRHMLSTILTAVAIVMLLLSEVFVHLLKEGKTKAVLCSQLKIIAMIILVLSIYFYS